MEQKRRIYYDTYSLIRNLEAINPKLFGYGMSFLIKLRSVETMYNTTLTRSKELEATYREESKGETIIARGTTDAWYETIAYFEGYLNAFYSLLQITAKVTPFFYEKQKLKLLERKLGFADNFGNLVNFLSENSDFDPELSSYLEAKLDWYKILRNNRHMITHEGSAFLGFGEDGGIMFIDYPRKGFSWFKKKKSTRELENYMEQSFNSLFEFLDFYVNHFRH